MKNIVLTLTAGAVLFGQTPAPAPAPAKKAAPAPAPKAAPRPPAPAVAPRALLNPALLKAKAPEVFKAKFTTTKGDFVVEAHRDWAPLGADRFYNLVKNGFFTDASFFRVLPGFVVQFGLSSWGNVNKVWETAKIVDDPVTQTNHKGYLTFATAGPNTRTTQLFINLNENAGLDPQGFAPFGMIIEGMDAVEKITPEYRELPQQDRITAEGKPYIDKNFPNMDRILSAKITAPLAPVAPPPAKKAAPAPAPKAAPAKPAVK
jgi:peptidyl-prolyl cis-trans isomerase A (cyclophilin A)